LQRKSIHANGNSLQRKFMLRQQQFIPGRRLMNELTASSHELFGNMNSAFGT